MRHPLRVSVRTRGIGLALTLLASGTCLVAGRAWAQGTIVHVVPSQPIPYSDYPSSQDIDINNDGAPDFNLSSPNSFDINLSPLNNNAIISVPEPPGDLGAFIYAFNQGAPISSSLDPVRPPRHRNGFKYWLHRLLPGQHRRLRRHEVGRGGKPLLRLDTHS